MNRTAETEERREKKEKDAFQFRKGTDSFLSISRPDLDPADTEEHYVSYAL